jgi:hypothetical protein
LWNSNFNKKKNNKSNNGNINFVPKNKIKYFSKKTHSKSDSHGRHAFSIAEVRARRTVQIVQLRSKASTLQQHQEPQQRRQGASSAHGNRLKTSRAPPDFLNAKFDASLARLIAACEVQAGNKCMHAGGS